MGNTGPLEKSIHCSGGNSNIVRGRGNNEYHIPMERKYADEGREKNEKWGKHLVKYGDKTGGRET